MKTLGSIILLKDVYRPVVDVARDGIRSVSFEMAIDFDVIKKRINSHGYDFVRSSSSHSSTYQYVPAKDYWELFDQRPDLVSQLVIHTTKGDYSPSDLCQVLQEHKELELDMENYIDYIFGKHSLYNTMCMAFLEKEFSLRVIYDDNYSEYVFPTKIYVMKKNKGNNKFCNSIKEFPTMFFLPSANNCPYLAEAHNYYYRIYNIEHPISQFIIHNCDVLKKYMPGTFQEILRTMWEDKKNELIKNMNDLLLHLRNVPGGLINVPAELSLSEKDFL